MMRYKMKPIFHRTLSGFSSFLITAFISSGLTLGFCFADMLIFDRGMKDNVAPWVIEATLYLIYGFPLNWYLIYQSERISYFFKEYLPWKKYNKEYTVEKDVRDLINERMTTELFIKNVRRK